MFRRAGTGASKASATTLCQKCLKRGHYSYECKASAQERPYKSRPSRTQQLLNPQLQPKLTTEVPNDLVRNKGVADDMLAKKDEARGRTAGRKRSRSASVDSVSTISTNRSPSRSPPPRRQKHSRRSASTDSQRSHNADGTHDRNTRRRRSSFSPEQRGRRGPPRDVSPPHSGPARTSPRRAVQRTPSPYANRPGVREAPPPAREAPPVRKAPPRETSLSPFSKRVALTRAMNAG